jgi:hypothetical protein
MLLDRMSCDEMQRDKILYCKIPFGKRPFDHMSIDKMLFDKMPFNKMTFDKMPNYSNGIINTLLGVELQINEASLYKKSFDKMPFDKMLQRRICKVCIVVFMTDFPLLKNGTTKGVGFLSTTGPVLKTVRRRN